MKNIVPQCHKAELSAQEGCSVATRKTWLALSRAHGARRFASWAVHSQREAYKHYALSEEKERGMSEFLKPVLYAIHFGA